MPLNDINKELYKKDSDAVSKHSHEQSEYDPRIVVGLGQQNPFEQDEHWSPLPKELSPEQKKLLKISLFVLLGVAIIAGGFIFRAWWQKNAFHQDRVTVTFEGPREADSTKLTKYIIHYKNDNLVSIRDVEMNINYSENFQPTDNANTLRYLSPSSSKVVLGDVKAKGEGTIELNGIFYAPKDSPVYIKAQLNFTPSNGGAVLAMDGQMGVNITAAPLMLEVSAPQRIANGDAVLYEVNYKNMDKKRMSDVRLHIDFPQGFQISKSIPEPSDEDYFWSIGSLEPEQGGKISIQGRMQGVDRESKNIIVSIGRMGSDSQFVVFNKQEINTRVVMPVLTVSQKLEGTDSNIVNAGDVIKYVISYQNTGNIGLRDSIVTAELNSTILDFSKINIDGGSFDGRTNTVTWKASDVPNLANIDPKTSGEVHFSVPVKSVIPVKTVQDKNFIISSVAKIDSPDIQTSLDENKIVGSNVLELKLASKVIFDTKGYYTDSNIKNSGPIPLETGKTTTFAIHWSVVNVSNDISGAKVIASLPSGIAWTGQIYPADEKIAYNPRTNQIIWDAGDIPAGTGVLVPPRDIEFQVAVTPQINQIGNAVNLVNKSIFTATDTFIKQDLTFEGAQKDTQLPEDPGVGYVKGRVEK